MIDLSVPHVIPLPDEAATRALGARLGAALRAGDVVYLEGGLGAGKSTLARGLIRALTSPEEDVPSPTFTLIQTYETEAFEIAHLDLYRLNDPSEAAELGLDDYARSAVLLIEWPEKLGPYGYDCRLDVRLEVPEKSRLSGRVAHVAPVGRFRT